MEADNYTDENQNPMTGGEVAYQSPLQTMGSSIVLLTNPSDVLHDIELSLRSVVKTADGNLKLVGAPLLNDLGVCSVLGQARTLLNRVSILSNLEKHDIDSLMLSINDTLIKDLMGNRVLYGINNFAVRDKVLTGISNAVYICLRRGYMEGERRFLKGSAHEVTTRVEGQQARPSLMAKMMGWGRK